MHIGTTVVHYTFRMAYPVNSACCQVALLTRLAVVSVTKWMTWWGWMLWINRVWVWHADMLKLTCLYSMISMIVWCYVISGKSFWHLPTWLLIPLCSFLLQGHYPCAVTLHLLTSPAVRGLESRTFSFDQALPVSFLFFFVPGSRLEE